MTMSISIIFLDPPLATEVPLTFRSLSTTEAPPSPVNSPTLMYISQSESSAMIGMNAY